MPHTKQASGDTIVESPTEAMMTGLPARSGIAVPDRSRPARLVAT
jgi:hypothetical protein